MPLPFTGNELRQIVADLFQFKTQTPQVFVMTFVVGQPRAKSSSTLPGSGRDLGVNTLASVVTITIDQEVDVVLRITDRVGHPARVDGVPVWSLQPDTTADLVVAADGMSATVRARDALDEGAVLSVTVDADIGEGIEPLIGFITVVVASGEASIIELNAGTPRPKVIAAPAVRRRTTKPTEEEEGEKA